METLFVKLAKQKIEISKEVFCSLLDSSHIKEYKDYKDAIESNEIKFDKLKELAIRNGVPYPIFFAPGRVAKFQINHKNKNLFEKIPTKDEIKLNSRGLVNIKDIELIVLDLGRKQEFLKRRVLPTASVNSFIGSLGHLLKTGASLETYAQNIREYFDLNLEYLRSVPKTKVLSHICSCIEKKGILVSFSSYNYMPQNLDPALELSGICIRDKKFPYIFINTRDGDVKPKIIESSGRQIFTLLSMVANIGMGQFLLSTKNFKKQGSVSKLAFAIAGEILIPKMDIENVKIKTLDELKEKAHFFRVTPSMLLYRMKENKKITATLAVLFQKQLLVEVKKATIGHKHPPLPTNAYGKYNGERFSREVVRAYQLGTISGIELKNILFRKGRKMDNSLFSDYQKKYR